MTTNEAWPTRVCIALERLEAVRENEKARESDLVKHRKQVKDDFLALGPGEGPQHTDLALDLVKTMFHIDYCRNRQKTLADQIGDTIRNANQPGLFGDDAELSEIRSCEPSDEELFASLRKTPKDDTDQQEFGDKPVGDVGIDPDAPGAEATARMDAEDAEDDEPIPVGFNPGRWEIQEKGKRGRGKQVDITSAEEMEQKVMLSLGDDVVGGVEVEIDDDGEHGTVSIGGAVRMTLKRRGGLEIVQESSEKTNAPRPGWRSDGAA